MRAELYGCYGCVTVVDNVLKSPAYPDNYPSNMDCVYQFPVSPYMDELSITFTYFHLEDSDSCSADYLKISNENNQTFGTYCGLRTGQNIIVTGQYALLTFHSDSALEEKGFHIELATGCGSVIDNVLKSPGYPNHNYPEGRMDCVYNVPIPDGVAMSIFFSDFNVEYEASCSFDSLTIANDTNHVYGKYCGDQTGQTVVVTGQYAVVTFHTDPAKTERGFLLVFTPVPLVSGRDCLDLLHKGYTGNAVYDINPDGQGFISALCDQQTNGGGWIVLQRRLDGSVDFYRDWNNYKQGFGDLNSEFWLGNDKIHKMTTQDSQLLIELKDFDNLTAHASYETFHVGTETEKYVVRLTEFSGTAGDSMALHNGMLFSTQDQDNDLYAVNSCAQQFTGAWWYNGCHESNLNGHYGDNTHGKGINWYAWRGHTYSLKESAMKVKPLREREWHYELIFSGESSDYILLPRITDLKDFTACWWLKTGVPTGWSTVFSLRNYENESVVSFSYNGDGSYLFFLKSDQRTFSVQDDVITDERWHHMCITRSSGYGNWTFYSDGVKKAEGVGLGSNYNTDVGYLLVGMFKGALTRFNMWDKYIDDVSRIEKLAHACSSLIGNVVPWPEVHLWRKGNVMKMNSTLCKFPELSHWNFPKPSPALKRTYDSVSDRSGTFKHFGWYTLNGVASINVLEHLNLGDYSSHCLSDPNLCHQGLSLSFWFRHRPRFLSNIPGFNDAHDNILGTWLDAVLPKEGNWLRCYRANPSSNWKGHHFHSLCDGKGPTVILIRVQQNIFGGFLDKNWGGTDGYISSDKAFIFSLKNSRGLPSFKMDLKNNKFDMAAKQQSQFGPIFGDDDIVIHNSARSTAESSTNLDKSYEFPSALSLTSAERDNLLAGTKYFLVDDLEVFYYDAPGTFRYVRHTHYVPDSQLTASYSLDDTSALGRPEHAILNNKQGSWCSYYNRADEWLELDLGSDKTIYGVAVQGAHDSNNAVTKYTISLRADGASDDTWLLEAISDGSMDYFYPTQYAARHVRFTVKKLQGGACMRVGILQEYCPPGWEYFQGSCYFFSTTSNSWSGSQASCQQSSANLLNIGSVQENDFINAHINSDSWIGLKEVAGNKMNWTDDSTEPVYVNWEAGQPVYEDDRDDCTYFSVSSGAWLTKSCGEVLNFVCEKVLAIYDVSQWSSSSWKCMTKPELARLHGDGNCHASWCGRVGDWLQIDLGQEYSVNSIYTQGARDDYGFVKMYTLSYKTSSGTWEDYKDNGIVKEFSGNFNGNTVVKHVISPTFKANFVKFNPKECKAPDLCCMRVEFKISDRCPTSNWEYFQGSCYLFTDHQRTWSDAMKYCRDNGADLIKVTSEEENNFVTRSGKIWWLALRRDATHSDIFRWNNGSIPTFANWSGPEPNNHGGSEECVEIIDTGKWNDIGCLVNNRAYLACEKENIDVILTTRGIGEHNPGILIGYQEFTGTYLVSVSTSNHNWELRLSDYPLSWVHVGITWSKQWGLRFYHNGVLAAEATNPARLPYEYSDKYTSFLIGLDSSAKTLKRVNHMQLADLRIWESVIPQQRMQTLHTNAALPWYMWKNTGNPSFQWKLKQDSADNNQGEFYNVLSQDIEYKQIGCYRIDSGPLIPSLEHNDPVLDGAYTTRQDSVIKCLNAARRKGHKMFAFKNGGECLSSPDGHLDVTTKYEESDECTNSKGGVNSMNIYMIKDNFNAAYKKPTSQSSVVRDSSLATDGSRFKSPLETCSLTSAQKDPWWRVDLEEEVLVRDVYIFNNVPLDYLLEIRIGNHDEPNVNKNSLCGSSFQFRGQTWRRIRCPVPLLGKYVTITRLVDNGDLMLCEVEVRQGATDYVETSMSYPRQRGDVSILESQYIVEAVNCLRFYYFMSGEDIGRLNIYVVGQNEETSLLWRLAGNQGNEWKIAQLPIDAVLGFKIMFESVSDDGGIGEIGIRDIRVGVNSSCACTPLQACPRLSGIRSAIISHIPDHQAKLMEWLFESGFGDKYWVPCYRGAVDGWSKGTFHSRCDYKGPTITLGRKDSYLFGGFSDNSWKPYGEAKGIPSSNAFLFTLAPFTADGPKKIEVLPEKTHLAIRIYNHRGPCWSKDIDELCFNNQQVNTEMNAFGAYDVSGLSDPSTYFTGETSFLADDVEVFKITDSLCDPTCWEGETCDEIAGKCVCDPTRRDEEMCRRRQELQKLKDDHCGVKWNSYINNNCPGRLFARYDKGHIYNTRKWRCYHEEALTGDRRRYDMQKQSPCYHSNSELESFTDEETNCRPLGMESGAILDSQITASSEHSSQYPARLARLNVQAGQTCWAALVNDVNQWLQVDFLQSVTLSKVATQGRHNYPQWVESYFLSYSMDGSAFENYKQCGEDKIFYANSDQTTIVYNTINPVIFTRYIRVLPRTWYNHISMRAEFYECDGYSYDVFEVEDLITNAKYLWTFDDANDIKDQPGRTWAQQSSSLQSVAGVRGRAVKTAGGPGPIRLAYDTKYYLSRPATWSAVTVSLWLRYQSTDPGVSQTFLAAGDQENGDRGVHLYQEDGSREELTFSIKVDTKKCTVKFGVLQQVWTHLIFAWSRTSDYVLSPITAYRDGKIVSDSLVNNCNSGVFAYLPNDDIALGSSTLPTASIDDVMVLDETLSQSQVEKLFRYYKGDANLHVNVSVELTSEPFHSELVKRGSEMFRNKSSWIETQVNSLYEGNSSLKVENFLFWNVTNVAAVNFTVRFKGTGYKQIEPLDTSIVSRSMLGSTPVKYVAMEANDVYVNPLQVTAHNTSSTSLAVSWDEPKDLTHGILCAVEVFYRLNESSQRSGVRVASGIPGYELTALEKYTLYAISVRPLTLEGEGKESDEVLVRTAEDIPTSPPLNVSGFPDDTEDLVVTWQPLPLEHRLGIILGYRVMYELQNSNNQQIVTVNAFNLSVALQNVLEGKLYDIKVAAFNSVGEGPPSPTIVVRSREGVPSLPPPIVVAHGTSYSSVMVTWTDIPEDYTNGILLGYVVRTDDSDQSFYGCSKTMEIQELEKSEVYKMKVAGYTSKGLGNFSEDVIAITNLDACHALGMEDYNISDSQITASSEHDADHAASNARLNFDPGNVNIAGSWSAASSDLDQPWLQVDFQEKVTVTKVATQGRLLDSNLYYQWVKSYSLNYSHDGVDFEGYEQFGKVKIFQGNWDSNTVVYNVITPPIKARYIRILPKSWERYVSMRAEFYTCEYDFTIDPVNITSSVPSATGVGLSWKPLDPYKLGEPVLEYRVEIFDLLRGERFNYTVNSSMTDVDLDILKPFTPYEFKVFGISTSWEGNITDVMDLKTQEDAPSEPPRNFTLEHTTTSELSFQLKPVDKYHINGVLRGYKVIYGESNTPNDTWKTSVINVTQAKRRRRSVENESFSINLEDLKTYTTYTVIVLAFTVKDGVPTLAANFTTAQDAPDDAPVNVTAYNTSSTSINVTWQPIPPKHRNGIILGYHVRYWRHDKANDNISMVTVNSTKLHSELEGLGKYKEYSIQVAGSTVVGLGNFSLPVLVRTEQDVPDEPPINITAEGIEPTVIKVNWSPVPYETINGIGIGYKLAVYDISGNNIRNYSLNASVLSFEITGLEIWTNYSVEMAAFTVVGDGVWSDLILEDTDEEPPYQPPGNLTGQATNSTSIFVQWDSVVLPNIRGILRGYTVYYEEAPSSVHPSMLRNVSVHISVTEAEIVNLHKFTDYHIWVTAFTTRNGLLSNSIFVRTNEDNPERPPLYIKYSAPSSTSLLVEWGPVPPQFRNGIIRGFQVQFQTNGTVEERERGPLLNWVILDGLKKFTIYSIQVRAFTSEGYGPENNITALTAQDVPSKPPEGIIAESHVTLTTIPVTWQPIDPKYIHGILLGYKIRYQAVAIGEEPVEEQPIREQIVSPSTLSIVLKNLEIFTLYRIDVLGYTIMGNGPSATDYAETCRCNKRLTTSWYEFRPYVQVSENDIPDGLIPPILSKLAVTCCETCQSHGTSYVDLNSNVFNQSAKLSDLRALKKSIANPTDFFFPVYGYKEQTHFARQHGYQGIVESPGMAYIVNTNSHDDMPNAILTNIAACWPAIILALVITYLAGLVVWAVEKNYNPQDFPPSFIEGAYEAFYWSFVSMTTVGYGDCAPISIIGRILAIVVILSGLVIFGIVNGYMATSITSVTLETDYKIYGAKVAAIAGTPEYRMGIRKNARMDQGHEYHTFEDIFTALNERHVIGALIDTYSAGSSKDDFENGHLRVNKILDYSATYGVVMGKEARKLRLCFKAYTEKVFANEIANHIQKNTEQLKEPAESLPVERTTGLFDSHSTVFQKTLLISSTLLISFVMCGIIWEIIRCIRERAKIKPQNVRQELVDEMKAMVDDFNENIRTIKEDMASKHEEERKQLLLSFKNRPSGKYTSSVVLTEHLDNPYFEPQSDAVTLAHDEPEADC
ncbi:uncharacterized protein LOC144630294 [Oculina patagonica]